MKKTTVTATIKGGRTLSGEITIVPNKNAVLPAIAASILTDGQMGYHNLPHSPDVEKMLKTLSKMGAEVDDLSATILICCKNIRTHIVPSDDINDMQAGYLLAGPLIARFGKASIPLSSGCRLGYRGFEDHAEYFKKIGVTFSVDENYVHFETKESIKDQTIRVKNNEPLHEGRSALYNSAFVTPTENILMLLSRTSRFETKISGIAQEPHVVQLIGLLRRMGAIIKGDGSTVSVIGKDILSGAVFTAEPDHVSYFGFAITAAMTKSDILLRVPNPIALGIAHMNEFLQETGVKLEVVGNGVQIYGSQSSFTPSATFPKFDNGIYKVNPGPWPMFPVDCLPSMVAWSSMNTNPLTSTRLNNWMYSDGLKYVSVLKEMGAKVSFDDQRVTTHGTQNGNPYLVSADITAPDVIEGCRAVISCALAGKGVYEIKNVQYIMRREPNFFERLKECGADIEVARFEEVL